MLLRSRAFLGKTRRRGLAYASNVALYLFRRQAYFLTHQLPLRRRPGARRDQPAPRFHFDADDIPAVVASIPATWQARTIGRADRVLERRFNFRNIGEHTFEGPIDWQFTLKDHISWRWDLNRHFYLLDLAMAFYYSGDRRYIEAVADLWVDWIDNNPLDRRANWEYPFEVAARLNNWIWAYQFLCCAGMIANDTLRMCREAMHDHAEYLYSNLELHWPNNHLLLEAKALLEFSIVFPGDDARSHLRNRSARILARQLDTQILPDGGHSELCPMYHRIVMGELTELLLLLEKCGPNIFPDLRRTVLGMAGLAAALARADGSAPLLGDSTVHDDYIRFGPVEECQTELDGWLPAKHGRSPGRQDAEQSAPSVRIYPHSGYASIAGRSNGERVHLVFDCGAFSRNQASDHSHCDALSFDLNWNDRPLLIDPGYYLPVTNAPRWHDYFRSTAAHNTLAVDRQEQSELRGFSDVKRTADVKLLRVTSTGNIAAVKASCTPYWAAEDEVCHVRELVYGPPGTLRVLDRVAGDGRRHLEWFFHFAPGVQVTPGDHGVVAVLDDERRTMFRLECSRERELRAVVRTAAEDPPCGWASLNATELLPICTVVYTADVDLPFECEFRIASAGSRTAARG